jgi:2-succinyl-6-hydroxy-2,4-cyclohexadiene-1-carboxylate synthase
VDADTPPLALLHGFTQTGRLWGTFGHELEHHHRLVQIDLPGHGSSATEHAADLWHTADLVLDAVRAVGVSLPFDVCGYSLGGRVALHVALAHPTAIRRLVLISATAGIDEPAARAERRDHDNALADELLRTDDVGGFIDRWLASPMFAHLDAQTAGREERRRNTAAGLAASLRHAGAGTQEPLWSRLGQLPMPVLLIAGAEDPRYVALATRLRDGLPIASLSVIEGAGHTAHLEQPEATARVVSAWLRAERA